MIAELSSHWKSIIDRDMDGGIMAPRLLEMVAMDCFVENKTGKAVDSLRRCIKAGRQCHPYRMTQEYNDLIDL